MTARKLTIADVAERAGVSKGLVSFALNDRPGVAPATRERILRIASEMGWSPSLRARSLSTRRSFALGLVIARDPEVIGSDPFFPSFIAGVESVLSTEGRVLVLSVVPDQEAELMTYKSLVADGRVDGVFVSDLRHDDIRIPVLEELGIPAVTLGVPDVPSPFPAVTIDDAVGIRAAVEHLVALGHTRIAHVAGAARFLHGSRRRGAFEQAMRDAGLEAGQSVDTDFSIAEGSAATRRLLAQAERPTAIIYANDPMAIAGLAVAQELGLRVPHDLSITGFDDTDISRYVFPALTTVGTDPAEWGRAAARSLLRLMEAGESDDVALPSAELVVRRSTAAPGRP
ncbi:LacI family DNA-binding transcriptional regulator [Compostimonas suwonensis]|uniref:DNA-binding LacI/PurR family transcriptional regulator n=1 Tax=Compostimonas suwonensis TaxID=1048394 RepID=A0A2M9C4I1_9MICO|nr:LacI family DNA-binding transcriptional regulator [Compostimonas suwonensis]PJJ65441.1 DNA-binding LacI/PurR family transcriptional regulator [Compostimonas suwonensis]